MAFNLVYTFLADMPSLPWAVVPMSLHAFGIALVFPVVTLAILDMYPLQRGGASSLQAFTSLVLNALVAGVLSPLLSSDPRWLAMAAAALVAIGWGFWQWEWRAARRHALRGMPLPTLPDEVL